VIFIWLNRRIAPFDHVRARRALAYATDRRTLTAIAARAGSPMRVPICQLLPPNVSGSQPYCPFTQRPSANTPGAPSDVDRARRLVALSGTAGAHITLHVPAIQPDARAIGAWYVRVLRRLGYRARLALDTWKAYLASSEPGHRHQIGWGSWLADAPTPAYMFPPLISCRPSEVRFSGYSFCSRPLDETMRRARALNDYDPAASTQLWARVDRAIVRSAAVIPLFTTPDVTVTSSRVRGYQVHPHLGPLLAQVSLDCRGPKNDC
jgi:peptide/nickel transport system substrate-binding protein